MHGIPSKYSDFADYCKLNEQKLFNAMNQEFPGLIENRENLWSNFELELGNPDIPFLVRKAKEIGLEKVENMQEEVCVDHFTLSMAFSDWISKLSSLIHRENFPLQFVLPEEACYLTFNYTLTLEHVYGVTHVYHIHSQYNPNNREFSDYIWGHNKSDEELNADFAKYGASVVEADIHTLRDDISAWRKSYDKGNEVLYKLLAENDGVAQIIVLGHSMSEVDYMYFKEINEKYPAAHWNICYHDETDLCNKRKSAVLLGLADKVRFIAI